MTLLVSLLAVAAMVFALSGEPHVFSNNECIYCHVDVKNAPLQIRSDVTGGCQTCHREYEKNLSHPTNLYPTTPIPADMPLTEGRLTCHTCHYTHPDENNLLRGKHYFLRREERGVFFCSACHRINEKNHIVFENVHQGRYEETDRTTRIDRMSLDCITCHDRHLTEPRSTLGAGTWKHFDKNFNHPIGIPYKSLSLKNMRNFRPAAMLKPEVKLYNGNIGCGTCHNVYSKEKAMLTMNNTKSRLCLECHDT